MPTSIAQLRDPARSLARAGLLLLAAVLCGCAERAAPIAVDAAPEQLFVRGMHDIGDLYIEPVAMRRLALSGMAMLAGLDAAITVGDADGNALTLRYGGRDIARYAEPSDNDGRRWGELVGKLVEAARGASPHLAALPRQRVDKAVFQGMLAALDRFSRYLDPETARDQRAALDGFGGIGVTLDAVEHQLRVAAVSPLGPADRAGIRAEDEIVAINGVTTSGQTEEDAIHQLRGPVGSAVALRVRRPGTARPRELEVARAFISDPAVTMSRTGNIAVLRIASFNRSTARQVSESIAAAQREAPLGGIVLDLRGNPGGLLDQAVDLADLFIARGTISATIGRHPASRQFFAASGRAVAPQIPLAVLINGGSASASEIVAAALQDAGRAVVIGSASYGKGTVQTVLRLPDGSELILTWARLVAPAGYLLQQHGVVPTLCTADLPDDPGALPAALQRAAAMRGAAPPRAALDETGWRTLRRSCPPRRTRPPVDLELAERLLADPALYGAALHAFAGSAP